MSHSEHQAASQTPPIPAGPNAGAPAALYEAGLRHLRAGRNLDAQLCCQQSLGIDETHADTLHLMGLLCLDAKQHDHALEWISRAIRQDPKPEYLASLGTTLQRQGQREDALKAFDKAVQLRPDVAELWKNLGNVLVDLERPNDALLSFQHALTLAPGLWRASNQCAVLLYNAGRFEEAITHLDRCLEQQPHHVPSLQLRALSLKGLKRYDEALAQNHQAYAIDPNDADTSNNIGDILHMLDRHDEALPWFDRAIALRPGYILAINNKAFLLGQMHRFDEAFAIYEGLQRDGLNTPVTDWNLSLIHMLTGNFEAGWRGREARWKAPVLAVTYPHFEEKMWLGEPSVAGRTVLIHADEGLGDCIQFARYVPDVAALGARVVLVVAQPIQSLLSGLPGVSQCLPLPGGPLPAFDLHCPLSSLPLAFKTRLDTIPSAISYLPPPPEAQVQAWESRLGRHDKLRVGLVWSGNPAHGNDRNRSIPLAMLSRILDVDATFVSLQKNPKAGDQATLLERADIIDLTADLTDFSDTAALVCCLDLVITVDTSVAHLSAALGRPTWILLPYTPDYRWLLDREDSPWYPTARLFRQSANRDYGEVLDRVREELQKLISKPSDRETRTIDQADRATPASLCETGLSHMLAERYPDARLCCQQALDIDSNHADALHLMGLLSVQSRQDDRAVEWIARAIQQDPKPDYLSNLGTMLLRLGRHEEAVETFDKAVQLNPADAELWTNLGNVLAAQKRPADALQAFQQALKLNPRHWGVANKSGFLLHEMGRFEEAFAHFNLCDELQANDASVLQMRGLSSRGLRRFEAYLDDSRRSYALDPNSAETRNNIGDALQLLGRYEEALPWFDQAVELQPHFAAAFTNKASALQQLHRFDDALAIYRHLKVIAPDNVAADWNLSLLQLLTGNFESGWAGREARWKLAATNYPKFSQPMWLGKEPVEGKTILVYADEGMGDSIQFVRYVPMLAARGARVIMVEASAVIPLFSGLPGIATCLPPSAGAALPAFDMHCPMTNLPLAFQTRLDTIPSKTSYLPAPSPARLRVWDERLGAHDKLRVGLVWSGNPRHHNDHNRSMQLHTLARILDAEATFVSLQKDPRPADKATLQELPAIIDLTADLRDLSETAALVSCLDLVISVDTSVAHLAAALGRPTWILLPYTPDHRWLLDREDSPWYPTARLFRQGAKRDYGEVLDRVRGELAALVAARQPG